MRRKAKPTMSDRELLAAVEATGLRHREPEPYVPHPTHPDTWIPEPDAAARNKARMDALKAWLAERGLDLVELLRASVRVRHEDLRYRFPEGDTDDDSTDDQDA